MIFIIASLSSVAFATSAPTPLALPLAQAVQCSRDRVLTETKTEIEIETNARAQRLPSELPSETAEASIRVIESAVELAKAELALGMSKMRIGLERAFVAAGLMLVAFLFGQVAIALICVSPVLFGECDPRLVALSLALSIGSSVALAVAGLLRLKPLFSPDAARNRGNESTHRG